MLTPIQKIINWMTAIFTTIKYDPLEYFKRIWEWNDKS